MQYSLKLRGVREVQIRSMLPTTDLAHLVPRHTAAKAWSPPSGSNTSETSTSSTSPSDSAVLKGRKQQRRRTFTAQSDIVSTSHGQSTRPLAASQSLPSTLTSNPGALLSLIKEVSQKVDEETDAKQRTLERARLKAKRKESDREKQMRRRIRDNRVHRMQRTEVPDDPPRDSGSTATEHPQEMPTNEDVRMDLDEDAQRMPPPPGLPVHRMRPGSSSSTRLSLSEAQIKKPPGKTVLFAENTNTRSATLRASTVRPPDAESKSRPSTSTSLPSPPLPAFSDSLSDTPIIVSESIVESSPPAPTFPSVQRMAALPSQLKAKPRAPVLGMRRALSSSQSPSHEQKNTLPTKQKKFKTPFAKPPPPVISAYSLTDSHSTSNASSSCYSSMKVDPDSRTVSVDLGTGFRLPTRVESNNGRTTMGSGVPANPISAVRKVEHGNARSSSPVAEANDSFTSADFDMGIDDDELEKACSAYD